MSGMNLWIDKYRPESLNELDYHKDQAQQLKNIIRQGDFPHLLVFGPRGAGKKTRVYCILRQIFGPGVDKMKIEHLSFLTPSKKKVDITTLSSNYHTEVNLSDVGIHDRIVVQELIKTVAQAHQIDTSGQWDFKVIVLTNVDMLTHEAQHALRRTMEKYVATCRLILCTESTSRVLPAIRSRCLSIRIPAPTAKEICDVLQTVCSKEDLTLPDELAERIATKSRRNLRVALLMCESCKTRQYPFAADQEILEPDWRVYLEQTAKEVVKEQSAQQLLKIRERLYNLYSQGIPGEEIIKGLLQGLVKNCDGQLKVKVASEAANKEYSLRQGNNPIIHMEAFVAKFMAVYKEFMEESLGDMF
ncbi:replication factor C subunit 3 [Ischnura elegans]|uniref:replication factor C subunit 3 n=1 Tax=Ischnura elegans TaxID=197161 RepID=UPI001ED87C24|nr:replication factor C subunit 3 [Ischnura elegans]